jgi:hypothetical protein
MARYPDVCPDCIEIFRGHCERLSCPKVAELHARARSRPASGRTPAASTPHLAVPPRAAKVASPGSAQGYTDGSAPSPHGGGGAPAYGTQPSVIAAGTRSHDNYPADFAASDRRSDLGTQPSVVAALNAASVHQVASTSGEEPHRAPIDFDPSDRRQDRGTQPSVLSSRTADGDRASGGNMRQPAPPPASGFAAPDRRQDLGTQPSVVASYSTSGASSDALPAGFNRQATVAPAAGLQSRDRRDDLGTQPSVTIAGASPLSQGTHVNSGAPDTAIGLPPSDPSQLSGKPGSTDRFVAVSAEPASPAEGGS